MWHIRLSCLVEIDQGSPNLVNDAWFKWIYKIIVITTTVFLLNGMVGDSQGTWAWNVYMCVCVCVCLSLLKVQTTPLNANSAAINNNNYNKCKILHYIQRGQPLNISRILPFPPRYFSLLPAFPTQNYNANRSTCKIRRGNTILFLKAMIIFYAHPYLTELRLYSSVKCLYIWRHHGVFFLFRLGTCNAYASASGKGG